MSPRVRQVVSAATGVVVIAGAVWLISRNRRDIADALAAVGPATFVVSGMLAVAGTVFVGQVWLSLVRGAGANVGQRAASEVFFVSQLGKYVPGSVWPVLVQMEWGRRFGVGRRAMLVTNILFIVMVCTTGLVVGGALLPLAGSAALGRYGWLLLFLVPAAVCLHPRVVPAVVDWGMRWAGRPSPGLRVGGPFIARAVGWALAAWLAFGLHIFVITVALGASGPSVLAAAVGGIALGWAAGLIVIPAPAGAGVRDAVIVASLSGSLGVTSALTVALASRVLLVLADVALAGAAHLAGRTAGSGGA